jgi:hypothetical protein
MPLCPEEENIVMKMHRRVFFAALLFARPAVRTVIEVEVLETFELGGRSTAVLAHHADAARRQEFASWLRRGSRSAVRVQTAAGRESIAVVFRVRLCFGRALMIFREPLSIRERDILKIVE